MKRCRWMVGALALTAALLTVGDALAGRLPSVRSAGQRMDGTKPDITVPYLNNGSNFNGYSVAPRIYSSPQGDDRSQPGARRVYNLPFYGGVQAFGSGSNGAVMRPYAPYAR